MLGIWNFVKIKRFYRINQYIQADKVRVVDEKGKQLGIMPLGEASFKAKQSGLDLVEVAPEAKPPVCKIINFRKFKYQESKKQRAGQKKAKQSQLKQIRFTPFIGKGDYETRVKKAKEFLKEGSKVKLTVKFVGRQITRKRFGYDLLEKTKKSLKNLSKVEVEPKWQGRLLSMVLKPAKQASSVKRQASKDKTI